MAKRRGDFLTGQKAAEKKEKVPLAQLVKAL